MVTTVHKSDSHLFRHAPARQFPIFEPNKKSFFERNMELFRKNVDSFTPPNLLVCSGQFGLAWFLLFRLLLLTDSNTIYKYAHRIE